MTILILNLRFTKKAGGSPGLHFSGISSQTVTLVIRSYFTDDRSPCEKHNLFSVFSPPLNAHSHKKIATPIKRRGCALLTAKPTAADEKFNLNLIIFLWHSIIEQLIHMIPAFEYAAEHGSSNHICHQHMCPDSDYRLHPGSIHPAYL